MIEASLAEIAMDERFEVIVADNASSDGTPDLIRTNFPRCRLIETGSNLGFARAVNWAASGARSEQILLLNPDAVVAPGDAVELFRQMGEFGATIGAPLIRNETSGRTVEAGREPRLTRQFLHWTGISRLSKKGWAEGVFLSSANVPDSPREVDWVSGACLGIRRDAWVRLNGLTDRWFMYAEDWDLCLRASDAGYRVGVFPGVRADHRQGQSSAHGSGPRPYSPLRTAWIVNQWELYCLHYRPSVVTRTLWKMVVVAGLLTRGCAAWLGVRTRRRPELGERVRLFMWSARDLATARAPQGGTR